MEIEDWRAHEKKFWWVGIDRTRKIFRWSIDRSVLATNLVTRIRCRLLCNLELNRSLKEICIVQLHWFEPFNHWIEFNEIGFTANKIQQATHNCTADLFDCSQFDNRLCMHCKCSTTDGDHTDADSGSFIFQDHGKRISTSIWSDLCVAIAIYYISVIFTSHMTVRAMTSTTI